jgi:hypothetical protein
MTSTDGITVPVSRFARGFILTEAEVEAPVPEWGYERVLGLRLIHAPDVPILRAEYSGSTVVVLGRFIDTGRWLRQGPAVSAAAQALSRSTAEFLDLTDAWSGRYLVLYGDATSRRVMTDAAGMRSAFYTLHGSFVLATHAPLVANIVGAGDSGIGVAYREAKQATNGHIPLPMPGRATPWTGVVALTANMALDVPGRELHRIFPRDRLPTLDPRAAASSVGPKLRGQVKVIVSSGQPVALSLTAGRDSRVSLAASRPFRDAITYFTYTRPDSETTSWDISTAESIARELRLSHRLLELASTGVERNLRAALDEATILSHNPQVVAAYRRSFSSDTIHIRSNIGEVGRGFYRSRRWAVDLTDPERAVTPESLARLWGYDHPPSRIVVEAFDDWMQAVGFLKVTELDPLDLFYWEHRMPCWHSNVVLESDFAFETHVLFNARTILRDLLAVPTEARVDSTVFRRLVADLWPELRRWAYKQPAGATSATPRPVEQASPMRRRIARLIRR